MKLILNSDICAKYHLSIDEALILLLIMRNPDYNGTFRDLVNRGLLQNQNGKCIISTTTETLLNRMMIDSGNVDERRLSTLASKMQQCFPEGKPQGSVNYFRANKREIIFQLQKFFIQYGDYSDEDIVEATQSYVNSFHGNYRYLPIITNFILKATKTQDEMGNPVIKESSQLATQLENKQQEEERRGMAINDDSWLFSNRN